MSAHGHDGSGIGAIFGLAIYWLNRIIDLYESIDILPKIDKVHIPLININISATDIHDLLMSGLCAIVGWLALKSFKWGWYKLFSKKNYE